VKMSTIGTLYYTKNAKSDKCGSKCFL